ncbi:hypothetical protein BJX99DRAFT_257378 [Aspergillus californicus]
MGLRTPYSQLWFPVLLEVLATAIFVLIAWIAQTTWSPAVTIAGYTVDSSQTLTLLSAFQGLLSTLVTAVLSSVFELIQWFLTARDNGLRSIGLLGLSPTTAVIGSMKIIFSRHSRLLDRLWPVLRLVLTFAIWISNIVLFANTSIGVKYGSVFDYQVTAGVGQFNGSYVRPYVQLLQDRNPNYPWTIVPYSMQAIVYNLVINPIHSIGSTPSPVSECTEDDPRCDSYLLPGGLFTATPWPPTNHPEAPMIQMVDVPSCQVDFKAGLNEADAFLGEDCTVFGANATLASIKFCVSKSRTVNGSFAAGIYVCPDITGSTCNLDEGIPYPNITATFSIFSRKATIITTRSNMSITSMTSSTPPVPISTLDLDTFQEAISWILDFNSAGIPVATSIMQQFYSGQEQLQSTYWSPELKHTFQSIIVFPLWMFNVNNMGNIDLHGRDINPNLPPEFYTTASVVVPHNKIMISTSMFSTFVVLQTTVHLFAWGVLAWFCIRRPVVPGITSYPLFDFSFKTRYDDCMMEKHIDPRDLKLPGGIKPEAILATDDGKVLQALKDCKHFLRMGGSGGSSTSTSTLNGNDNGSQQQLAPVNVAHGATW